MDWTASLARLQVRRLSNFALTLKAVAERRPIRSYPPKRLRSLAGGYMYFSARRRPERVVLTAIPLATGADGAEYELVLRVWLEA